ncbi:hypothetical protein [Methylobacterium sp. Leaf108]|uniref:hypothetical protein n=1 Tax=Methylobacterium sp. Leaf108 TaxID=1736256 RepID=UPI0006FDCAC8|nr:hypothetical protein [Methylobacterium sp. Leaf108]KQP51493.1 hypothetical protein ASF39_10805 [Methylobacterium sp. Leaf108]
MIQKHLPSNATLADVFRDLAEPEEYLRRLLGNMRFCQKHHGAAFVRIGVSGKGTKGFAPSYRVDYPAADGSLVAFNGFGGTSHSAFTPTNTLETNWSHDHLAIREVQALYDDVKKDETLRARWAKD